MHLDNAGMLYLRVCLVAVSSLLRTTSTVPDNKSQNIPEVVIVRHRAGGVLGIWEGWVNWVKGGANGVSLQAT